MFGGSSGATGQLRLTLGYGSSGTSGASTSGAISFAVWAEAGSVDTSKAMTDADAAAKGDWAPQ